MVRGRESTVRDQEQKLVREEKRASKTVSRTKRVFVVMPFSKEFDDIFLVGIRAVAEKLGLVVERADTIQHTEEIVEVIRQRILKSDLVIADTSAQNPNVHYEVGFAHASKIPTILIARKGESIPFDLRNMNHIFYDSISGLQKDLLSRIKAVLHLQGAA
jgi:nucleoside 2-deoxyribosyltransferase